MSKLTIVIPVYNEAATIQRVLDRIGQVDLPHGLGKEIIVVNDCSRDNTQAVLEAYRDAHPEMPMILAQHDVNQGKGGALHTGMRMATGEYLIVQDADLEYDPREYSLLLPPVLEDFADVVYGSRFIGGSHIGSCSSGTPSATGS